MAEKGLPSPLRWRSAVGAVLVLAVTGAWRFPGWGGSLGDGGGRILKARVGSKPVAASLPALYRVREKGGFSVLHTPGGEEGKEAARALGELEELAPRVSRELGLPLVPLHLVLCSRESRASCVRHGGEEITGSYAAGWLWLYLSPGDPLFAVTLVHETAHALAARSSRGRVPLWLDEGWALLAEELVLGERPFARPEAPYPLQQLEREFASLDPEAAYREAYFFASFLWKRRGREVWARLLREAARGASTEEALQAAAGKDLSSLEAEFREWLGSLDSGARAHRLP